MFYSLALLVAAAATIAAAPAAVTADLHRATGTFDVKTVPNTAVTGDIGLLAITKTYHGDLDGTGTGQMLGAGEPSSGTAAYVALEQVTGALAGRKGGFSLQHSGWMNAGNQVLTVTIAPGSGTGELKGIAGDCEIVIIGGVHHYTLHYSLPK